MSQLRDVFLSIGKQSYSIKTRLDKETLERVRGIINDACGRPAKGVSQEDLLMLTCLQLAYMLDTISGKLFMLNEDVAAALEKEWPPADDQTDPDAQEASCIDAPEEDVLQGGDIQPTFLPEGADAY